MTKEEKKQVINDLTTLLTENDVFYLADTNGLTVEKVNHLRKICFQKNVQLRVVKNTLLKKAMESTSKDFSPLFGTLHGTTAIMTADVANVPGKILKAFRQETKLEIPGFKGAYVDSACFIGEEQLNTLTALKSKQELIGDIVALLQSPAKNVISALQSNAGGKVAGIVKALEDRSN